MASSDVIKLEFPQNVRLRPGMFVGDLYEASVLLRETIDNSIDELYHGADNHDKESNKIWVETIDGSSYLVADNARGIPIKESTQKGVTMARLAVSELSAGSKFNKNSMAIGMNGCFSGSTEVLVSRDGEYWWAESFESLSNRDDISELMVMSSEGPKRILMCGETKRVMETVRITLETGVEIECTPDHKFLLTDGYYKEAANLTEDDDLFCVENSMRIIKKSKANYYVQVPVYDIAVNDEVHNFKLASGPVVHNCGVACVNALSTFFTIMSRAKLHDLSQIPEKLKHKLPEEITDYTYYFCRFEKGVLKEEGFKEFKRDGFNGEIPSTITTFTPDTSIYKSARARIPGSLSYVKFILDNLGHESHIYVNGEEYKDQYQGFGYDLKCTLKSQEEGAKNPDVRFLISVGFQEKLEPCEIVGSVNGLDCRMGFHIKLVQNAFDKAFSEMYSKCNRTEFMGMRLGVVALCNEPDFASQTKERLTDIDGFKTSGRYEIDTLAKYFKVLMKDNDEVFKRHEAKILEYMKSTEKIGRKEFIKSTVMIAGDTSRPEAFVPNKLNDCSTQNRMEAELYLCEGRSAAGALKQARDPRIHAILGLRGKPLNTAGLEIERVLSNNEMRDLISSIGVGVNDYHNMSEVRYGKVILVADKGLCRL